jgi:hypothetical protein
VRYLCVTVTEASREARSNLERLIDSLERQHADVDLVLVVRGGREHTGYARGRVLVHPLVAPRRIALSVARNVALGHAQRSGLLDHAHVVAFPDDDCRYPDGLLSSVAGQLASAVCDFVAGAYGPSADMVDRCRFPAGDASLTPGLIMRTGCSGSMFFTAGAVRAIGKFDERLGLGAEYGASEDADYLLRALALGLTGVYRPLDVVVEHPYKPHRPAQYYVGNVAVLAKHARGRVGTRLLLGRRLLGGLLLAGRSQMPIAELRRAMRASLAVMATDHRLREGLDAGH